MVRDSIRRCIKNKVMKICAKNEKLSTHDFQSKNSNDDTPNSPDTSGKRTAWTPRCSGRERWRPPRPPTCRTARWPRCSSKTRPTWRLYCRRVRSASTSPNRTASGRTSSPSTPGNRWSAYDFSPLKKFISFNIIFFWWEDISDYLCSLPPKDSDDRISRRSDCTRRSVSNVTVFVPNMRNKTWTARNPQDPVRLILLWSTKEK